MGPWDLSWLWNKLCDSGKVMGPLCAPVSSSVGMDHAVFRVSLCSGAQNQDPEPLLGERSGHKVETPVTGQEVTLGMVTFWGLMGGQPKGDTKRIRGTWCLSWLSI